MRSERTTTEAPPRRISSPGMPCTTELAASWAMVRPPLRCSSVIAWAPSSPMPVSCTPISRSNGTTSMALRTSLVTLGCQR